MCDLDYVLIPRQCFYSTYLNLLQPLQLAKILVVAKG